WIAVADRQADGGGARGRAGEGGVGGGGVAEGAAGRRPGKGQGVGAGVAVVRGGRQRDGSAHGDLGRVGLDAVDGRADVQGARDHHAAGAGGLLADEG